MKPLALLLCMAVLLSACTTAPTHPSLTVPTTRPLQAHVPADLKAPLLTPLVPARAYVADWDGNGGYQISPDGKQLAWAARKGLNQGLFVKDLETGAVRSYRIPTLGVWARNSRHLYLQLHNGDENSSVLALDTRAETDTPKNLTPFAGARSHLLATIAGSDDVWIISNQRDHQVFDLYRYRAHSGQLDLVEQNPGTVQAWLIDRDGLLLGRARKSPQAWVFEAAQVQDGGPTAWEQRFEVGLDDTITPLQGAARTQTALALSNRGRNTVALVQVDLRSGAETVLLEDQHTDVEQVTISPRTGQPLAALLQPDMPVWRFLDPAFEKQTAQWRNPAATQTHILSISDDERWLTVQEQDAQGGRSVLVDSHSGQRTVLGELSTSRIHAISPLPERQALRLHSRDGLALTAYLTLPQGADGARLAHLPTVLLVHGGPWARDRWGDDTLPRFLANRGYAVLQVNYRGSTGFGKAFEQAAKGEFAGKMHTDLLDALDHLVARGIADPNKVAIMGASYGGYASLVGMTHTPGRFACAISLFGLSDLPSLINDFPPYWALTQYRWHDYVGNPSQPEDLQRMRAQSPLYQADRVQGPILMVQGALDARVQLNQATRMVQALQDAGKPVRYVELPQTGHGAHRWIDRLTIFRQAEDFLAPCLGGRSGGFDFFELGKLLF